MVLEVERTNKNGYFNRRAIAHGLIPRPFGSETRLFAKQTPTNTPMALPRGSLLRSLILSAWQLKPTKPTKSYS